MHWIEGVNFSRSPAEPYRLKPKIKRLPCAGPFLKSFISAFINILLYKNCNCRYMKITLKQYLSRNPVDGKDSNNGTQSSIWCTVYRRILLIFLMKLLVCRSLLTRVSVPTSSLRNLTVVFCCGTLLCKLADTQHGFHHLYIVLSWEKHTFRNMSFARAAYICI